MEDKVVKGQTVFLGELTKGLDTLEGWTFVDCHIRGPMVLIFLDTKTTLDASNLSGTHEQVLWVISPERRTVWGALGLRDCRFEKCTFLNVGFAGRPDWIARIRAQVNWNVGQRGTD